MRTFQAMKDPTAYLTTALSRNKPEIKVMTRDIIRGLVDVKEIPIPDLPPVDMEPIHHESINHRIIASVMKQYCDRNNIPWEPWVGRQGQSSPDARVGDLAVEVGSTRSVPFLLGFPKVNRVWVFPYMYLSPYLKSKILQKNYYEFVRLVSGQDYRVSRRHKA